MRMRYPTVKLNIDLYTELDEVKAKEYDIIIDEKSYLEKIKEGTMDELCTVNNYFVCGNKLYDGYKDIKSIKEIEVAPFISYKPSLKMGKFRELCYKNDVIFKEILSINESSLYFSLVKENLGIGFSNELLLKKYLNDKSLFIINISEEIFKDVISVIYNRNDNMVNNFVTMLKDYIKEEMK